MNTGLHHAALLVMDVQPGITDRITNKEAYLKKVQFAVDTAHKKNIPVLFVVVGFRQGLPEINANNKSFNAMKNAMPAYMVNPQPVIPMLEQDVLIVKRRVSAFAGSDLEMVLRAKGVQHLILTGIATGGVVLSTLREAADKDYQITVLSDLCADTDEEVHNVLMGKVFPRQAAVIKLEEWLLQTPV